MTVCGRGKEACWAEGEGGPQCNHKASVDPTGNSELGLALQSCPLLGQRHGLYTLPHQPVTECGLSPRRGLALGKASVEGNSQRGQQPAAVPAAGR